MVTMSKAAMEKKPLPKRFYAAAKVQHNDGHYGITLDGKNIRTPQGKLLQCASQQLARHIAEEWAAQQDVIDTDSMPLTRLLNIALDRVPTDRAALLNDIAGYGETDLLFYHAPQSADTPILDSAASELAALQHEHFSPVLAWAQATHGLHFHLTAGVMPIAQPAESLAHLQQLFSESNDHALAALAMMVPLLGSALLTLAVWHGALDVETALIAARLDETVQQRHWGEDPATAAAWAAKCRDVRACAFFLTCNQLKNR